MGWEIVIGLETHVQLSTASKIFSGASTQFGAEPNTQACAVDLALPGVLPVMNREAVGCAIKLTAEQSTNPYVDVEVTFDYFFVRKVMLVKYSYAFIVMQGGFGTGDEMFEALTLIQTAKIEEFPVVLMGVEYWAPLVRQIEHMVETGMVSRSDLDLFIVTDSVTQAVTFVEERAVRRFALARKPRAIRVLGEHRAR